MAELAALLFLGTFPVCRLWWVYRVKAKALNAMSCLAQKDIDEGQDWEARHRNFEAEESSLWTMFFQLHRWSVAQFYSCDVIG